MVASSSLSSHQREHQPVLQSLTGHEASPDLMGRATEFFASAQSATHSSFGGLAPSPGSTNPSNGPPRGALLSGVLASQFNTLQEQLARQVEQLGEQLKATLIANNRKTPSGYVADDETPDQEPGHTKFRRHGCGPKDPKFNAMQVMPYIVFLTFRCFTEATIPR